MRLVGTERFYGGSLSKDGVGAKPLERENGIGVTLTVTSPLERTGFCRLIIDGKTGTRPRFFSDKSLSAFGD